MRELRLPVITFLVVTTSVFSSATSSSTTCSLNDHATKQISHEYDCTKFYKCQGGQKRLASCPVYAAGHRMYFNPESQSCDWPWNVTCSAPRCSEGINGFLPHPDNCKLYYNCKDGTTILNACKFGQLFDINTMACTDEEHAYCGAWKKCPPSNFDQTVRLPHQYMCTKYYECIDGKMIEKYCPTGKKFDIKQRKCISDKDAICQVDSNKPISSVCPPRGTHKIPHENCKSYYICVDGDIESKEQCPDGLFFDVFRGLCTWPSSDTCQSSSSNEIQEECPSKDSREVMRLPHHCSCKKYYECVDGDKILHTCKDGKEFDYIRQICDVPGKAVCKNRQLELATAQEISTQTCSSNDELLPHENECTYYYACVNGIKQLRKCYNGHYFNEQIHACDLIGSNNCSHLTPMTTTTTTTVRVIESAECICRRPHEGNRRQYEQRTDDGRWIIKNCPDKLVYNEKEEICDWPSDSECVVPTPPETCAVNEVHSHECRCDFYYKCQSGGLVLRKCPSGLLFDCRQNKCIDAHVADCCKKKNECGVVCNPGDSSSVIYPGDCLRYCQCDDGVSEVKKCPRAYYFDPEFGRCVPAHNNHDKTCDPFPCSPGGGTWLQPHECRCDIYYRCEDGIKYREKCETGKFDYISGQCKLDGNCYSNYNSNLRCKLSKMLDKHPV